MLEEITFSFFPLFKVVEVDPESGKYSCDMRFVSQKDGKDLDPDGVDFEAQPGGKGRGGRGRDLAPLEDGETHGKFGEIKTFLNTFESH